MSKKIISIIVFGMVCTGAFGATDWWNHPTICTIDETRCYGATTPGLDDSLETGWDVSGGCRGKKYICTNALTIDATEPVAMERADITSGNKVISDFDTTVYVSGDNCYGARRSRNGGTMVSVNGNYVRVWCNGVLSNPDEQLTFGEITVGNQPTCSELAADGYAPILNGKCYGKYYNPNSYAITCDGETPKLTILNGATDYNPNGNGVTESDATAIFKSMVSTSTNRRNIYFNK